MLEPKEMEKYFEKEENKSLGFRIGTISLSHKLLCRLFILCLCGLFSFVLVSVFVSIRGEVGCRNRVCNTLSFFSALWQSNKRTGYALEQFSKTKYVDR